MVADVRHPPGSCRRDRPCHRLGHGRAPKPSVRYIGGDHAEESLIRQRAAGTSGSTGARLALVTASARSLPDRIYSIDAAGVVTPVNSSTSPNTELTWISDESSSG